MESGIQSPPSFFSSLSPSAPLPYLAYRQTLALALIPLGTILLLAAAFPPDAPSPASLAPLAACFLPVLLFALFWPLAIRRKRAFPAAGLIHYLVRCLTVATVPILLGLSFNRVLNETAGVWPLVLLAAAIVLHPVSRILHETASPRLELARLWVRQTEVLLVLLAVLGLLSGAILEAHKDYPTDPTVLLLLLWMLGILLFVASLLLAAFQWQRLHGAAGPAALPQTLDDPDPDLPPGHSTPLNFRTDEF